MDLDHTFDINQPIVAKICPFAKSHRQHFNVVYIKQAFLVGARETCERL